MDLCSMPIILALLERHGFSIKKGLGQNFLTERWVPERIAEVCGAESGISVFEVGPGIGTLTVELAKRAKRVLCCELDKKLLPVLSETLSEFNNVEVVEGDILKLDIAGTVQTRLAGERVIACANLPYYITTSAIEALLASMVFESVCVMVQKEAAERICAEAGSPEYCAFSVFVRYYSEPEILFDVPSSCFHPRPKVDSSVMIMRARDRAGETEASGKLFFKVVCAAFGERRKMFIKGLCREFGSLISREELSGLLEIMELRPDIRGEKLDFNQFAKLSGLLSAKLVGADK